MMMMTTDSKADRTEPRGRSDCLTLMHTPPISIGIFIDGGYFSKINDELRRRRQLQIDIHGYLEYIRGRIAQHAGTDPSDCLITESHYFRGRFRAATANEKHILLPERYFEDALIDNDVIFHYKHLREVPNSSGGTTIVEKGVDVWFALEAYELTSIRRFDYVVLITGDADHEMLIRKLKALKVNVLLYTWNLGPQSATSPFLEEEAPWHIDMEHETSAHPAILNQVCRRLAQRRDDSAD